MLRVSRLGLITAALFAASVVGVATGVRPALADGPDQPTQIFTFNAEDNSMTVTFYSPTFDEEAHPPALQAISLDQNRNPVQGGSVNLFTFDPTRYRPTCATTGSLLTSGLIFNPIIPGSFPGPSASPQSGLVPNPGAGFQAGSTTLGAPFPLTTASTSTYFATPIGYQCYANPFSIIPGAITVLTDATGGAFFNLAPIPQGRN